MPVENPAGPISSAKVVSFRGRPPIAAAVKTPPPTESTPVRGGRRPVSIAAREAEQQCHPEYQAVNVMPSAASLAHGRRLALRKRNVSMRESWQRDELATP